MRNPGRVNIWDVSGSFLTTFLYELLNFFTAYKILQNIHTPMSKIFATSLQNNNKNYPTKSFLWRKQTLIIFTF